jgi:hypothetical protein
LVRKYDRKRPHINGMDLKEMGSCGLDSMAQDKDQWWALVNMIRKLQVYKRWGIS